MDGMKRIFPILTLSLLITIYTLTLGYLSIARHWSFQTAKLDLGINHQAVWSTLHGYPFHLTPLRLILKANCFSKVWI
jgi:uncharacterized membrane protein